MGRRSSVMVAVLFVLVCVVAAAQWTESEPWGDDADGASAPPALDYDAIRTLLMGELAPQQGPGSDTTPGSTTDERYYYMTDDPHREVSQGAPPEGSTVLSDDVGSWIDGNNAEFNAGLGRWTSLGSQQEWAEGALQFRENMRSRTVTMVDDAGNLITVTVNYEVDGEGKLVADTTELDSRVFDLQDDEVVAWTDQEYDAQGNLQTATYTQNDDGSLTVQIGARSFRLDENGDPPEGREEEFAAACDGMPGCADEVTNQQIRAGEGKFLSLIGRVSINRIFAGLLKGYQDYRGLLYLTSFFGDEWTREAIEQRKQELSQSFCVLGGIGDCVESLVCNLQYDDPPENNAIVTLDALDAPTVGAMVRGYKVGPLPIKGASRQQLRQWLNQDLVYLAGAWRNLSDPSFDSSALPDLNLYYYLVQYAMNNPSIPTGTATAGRFERENARTFNLHFEGDRLAKWFVADQELAVGQQANDVIMKYTVTDYDRVCLRFYPAFDIVSQGEKWTFGGWSGWGWGSHGGDVDEVCDSFVVYDGPPTMLTGDPGAPPPPTDGVGDGGAV